MSEIRMIHIWLRNLETFLDEAWGIKHFATNSFDPIIFICKRRQQNKGNKCTGENQTNRKNKWEKWA